MGEKVLSDKNTMQEQDDEIGERMHNRLHSYNIECPQCGENHKYTHEKVHKVATTPRREGAPVVSVKEALEDEMLTEKMYSRLHSYNIECKQCGTHHSPFTVDTSVIEHVFATESTPEEELGEKMHNRLHSYNIECPQCGENHKYTHEKVHKVATTPRREGAPVVSIKEALEDEELTEKMYSRLHSYNIECKQCGTHHSPFTVDTSVIEHVFAAESTPEEELGEKMHNRLHSYNIECKECGTKNNKCDCKS